MRLAFGRPKMKFAAVSGFTRAPAWSQIDSQGIQAIDVGGCPILELPD